MTNSKHWTQRVESRLCPLINPVTWNTVLLAMGTSTLYSRVILFMLFSPAGYPRARFLFFFLIEVWEVSQEFPKTALDRRLGKHSRLFSPYSMSPVWFWKKACLGVKMYFFDEKQKAVPQSQFILFPSFPPRVFRDSVIRKVLHLLTVILWKIRRVLFCHLLAVQIGSIIF